MATLRDACLGDVPALCAAERAVVGAFDGLLVSDPDELHEAAFAERIRNLADGSGKVLVVEDGGAVVAHACLWPMGLRRIAHVVRLDICVHLGHWRRGHGRALLEALIAWARQAGAVHKIELSVRASNAGAVALYRSLGFVEEGRLRDRVRGRDGRYIDDLSMALFVKPAAAPTRDPG